MARRTNTTAEPEDFEERILDVDVSDEMRSSFLEYAYSVIYSRALPDARDGLKPVQRRILFSMAENNIRPDRGHVKSARVVGEVMGKYHPHGDGAIYDALVRTAQPWSMRLPLIDGHGNFGSLDDGPAAMRYTECRMAPSVAGDDQRPGRERRRLQAELRRPRGRAVGAAGRLPEPAGQRRRRDRGRDGHQHGPAQPDRGDPGAAAPDQDAERRPGRPDAVHPRPGPADRRQDRRPGRHQGRLPDRPRQLQDARHRPDRERHPAPQGHRGHRAAVHGRPGEGDREDQDPGPGEEAAGHRRRQGPDRPGARHPAGDRGQERLRPRGTAGAALQADPAGGLVLDQRGLPGRRPAAHPRPARTARGLPRTTGTT